MTRTPVTSSKSHGKGQAGSSGEPGGQTIHADDLAEMVEAEEREAAARARSHGLADAEQRLRRQLAQELVEALRRPLIEGHPPSDLEEIAALAPHARPAR